MAIDPTSAALAYQKAVQADSISKGSAAAPTGEESFSNMLASAIEGAVNTTAKSEEMSIKGIKGEAELVDVVTAVTAAEVALQTVVAVRDRVISSYQEIMRMPM